MVCLSVERENKIKRFDVRNKYINNTTNNTITNNHTKHVLLLKNESYKLLNGKKTKISKNIVSRLNCKNMSTKW